MKMIEDFLQPLPSLDDPGLAARVQNLLDQKTKPLRSLGRLEALALQLALIQGREQPHLELPQMVVFAADHGIAARGVSAYPSDVTWQMVENFLAGGAAVSVLARQHGLSLTVVDCGVCHDFAPRPGLVTAKVRAGTRDSTGEAAMTADECAEAMANGANLVRGLSGNVILFGEMGIGNTSAASLLMARVTGLPLEECVGRGTGLDADGVQRKLTTLRQALECHSKAQEPLAALAALGGLEIATMVGAMLQAASERRVLVIDGFIVGAALLVAQTLQPTLLERCIFAHCSAEAGHRAMLAFLEVQPLLQLDLRLGEGSGAALAWPLLESACRILGEMASFASAGVSEQTTGATSG